MNQTATYDLLLCNPDGAKIALVPASPQLPRWVHMCDDVCELSDSETPDTPAVHIDSFARVVCVHVDADKHALYVRTTS